MTLQVKTFEPYVDGWGDRQGGYSMEITAFGDNKNTKSLEAKVKKVIRETKNKIANECYQD